jgi:hypothetical protein
MDAIEEKQMKSIVFDCVIKRTRKTIAIIETNLSRWRIFSTTGNLDGEKRRDKFYK